MKSPTTKRATAFFLAALAAVLPAVSAPARELPMAPLLLDDFSADGAGLGGSWEGFTDRVMGGVSDMRIGLASEDGRRHLAMSGNVSLRNNGGFIQARLLLRSGGRNSLDASAYTGVRLLVRGEGDGYYLFLRTTQNVLPWSFFMAPIGLSEDWQELLIPFSDFGKGDFGSFSALDLRKLSSIAVVAYKKEFSAKLDLREIGFY